MTFFKDLLAKEPPPALQDITKETGIERKRVLRTLLHVREAMAQAFPA